MKKFLPFILPFAAFALPQGGSGNAEIVTQGKELHITTEAQRAAINWQDFSIGADESVRFMQPSVDSAVLNNVISGSVSHLMGTLESNGHVYIVNPNGILIGKDALINVHSLIASTLKITNEDFLSGNDHFAGSEQSKVINLGTLRANGGDIHVISYQVDNKGAIEAPEGTVSLTAANEAWLQSKEKRVLIKTSLGESSQCDGVTNSGTITALQTELDADGNLYKFAINHSGKIDATSLKSENGRVYLRAENGMAQTTGTITAPGGHVEMLAERAIVTEDALIDVSHDVQGGAILIGGDWRGANTPFRADHTYLGERAVLRSDGLGYGSGGRVILWGDLSSRAFGGMSACGGDLGGDGGKIEISRVPLLATERIYTDAPHGKMGTLLLDPRNVTISSATQDPAVILNNPTTYSGTNDPVVINASDLGTALNSSNVTINSENLNGGGSDGNITITAPVSWTAATTLTLEVPAAGTIEISANITASHEDAILAVAGPVEITNSAASTVEIYLHEIHSTNASTLTISNTGSGAILVDAYVSSLAIGTLTNPMGTISVQETGGGQAYIAPGILSIYSSGGLTVSANSDGGDAYVESLGAGSDSITVGGAVSVSNAGNGNSVHISTPELISTNNSTITVSNTSTGAAGIKSPTGSLVLGTSDDPVGTVTVQETGGGTATITDDDLSIYSSGGLVLSADANGGQTILEATSATATGSITVGGAVSVTNAGSSNFVLLRTPELISTADSAITISNTGVGTAQIISPTTSVVLGTLANPVGTVIVQETGGGTARILDDNISIYSSGGITVSADTNNGDAFIRSTSSGSTDSITVGGPVSVSNAGTSESVQIVIPELISTNNSAITVSNTGTGNADILANVDLVLGTSTYPVGTVTVQETGGGDAIIFASNNISIYSSGGITVSADANDGSASIRPHVGGDITVGGPVSVSNAGGSGNVYIQTPELKSTNNSTITVTSTGIQTGAAEIISPTGSLVLGTSDDPVGTVTVQETAGGEAAIKAGIVSIKSSGDLDITSQGTGGLAYLEGESGALDAVVTGAISIKSSGANGGDAYIQGDSVTLGESVATRFTSLELSTETGSTGSAYITSASGDIAIYGDRTPALDMPSVSPPDQASPLGYTPADGDAYISAGASVNLDLANFTTTSTTGNTYIVGSTGVTFGVESLSDDPMWALSSAQNFVFEAGSSGTVQFNQGLTNSGTGTLTLRGGAIQLGQSDNTQTNTILVNPTGALTVDFIHNSGSLAIYGSDTGNKNTFLTSEAASSAITVQEASGISGGSILIQAGSGIGALTSLGQIADTQYSNGITVDLNSGANAPASHKSIQVSKYGELISGAAMSLSVPRDIEVDSGRIENTATVDAVTIAAENITVTDGDISSSSGPLSITSTGLVTVSAEDDDAKIYGNKVDALSLEVTAPGGITIRSTGSNNASIYTLSPGDLDIGWTSKGDIGDILIEATGSGTASIESTGALNINGSGDITLTSSNTGDAYISSTDGLVIGSTADGRARSGAIMVSSSTNSGDAYIESDSTIAMTTGAITLTNEAGNVESKTYIEAGETVDINSSGEITLVNRGAIDSLGSDVVSISSGVDKDISISACTGLTLLYNPFPGGDPSTWSDMEISAGKGLTIECSGQVRLEHASPSPNAEIFMDLLANTDLTINAASVELVGLDNNNTARLEARFGNMTVNTGTGSITIAHNGTLPDENFTGFWGRGSNVDITCGDLTITGATGAGVKPGFRLVEALSLAASGDVSLTNGEISGKEGSSISTFTVGGTLTSNGSSIVAATDDLALVVDGSVLLQGACAIEATAGSLIIACDQATVEPGIGHIDISEGSTLTATTDNSGELRIFCGFFENNTVSTSADLNGGTFSGVLDTPDANNFYNIVYDPDNLPSQYGAPYTFYYEDTTPEDTITAEVERANILLSATMVGSSSISGDAAYTKLAQMRRQFIERGRPFLYGQEKVKRRGDEQATSSAEKQ